MAWVIVNMETWRTYRGNDYAGKVYTEERVAKAQYTRLTRTKNAAKRLDPTVWALMDYTEYREREPMVETVNIMTGKVVMERASEAGGPTSVGSESYWCS